MPYVCPRCGSTSYSERDEQEGYCGLCHDFTQDLKPPENVHVQWSDGQDDAVDCVYTGRDPEDGTHVWKVILHREPSPGLRPKGMTMDKVPANTSVAIEWPLA